MNIFDIVTANEVAVFWNNNIQNRPPFIGETLFPDNKQLGLKLAWIKGASGVPVVLKPSAFDVNATIRPRIGFSKLEAEMPFFKESKRIDESLRQELNMVMQTSNQAYIDVIANRIFDDQTDLLEGARARREQMRMMMLTTGAIAMEGNGQTFEYDYDLPSGHKSTVTTSWSDTETSTPLEDLRAALDKIEEDTGVRPTRGMISAKAWGYLRRNAGIISAVYLNAGGTVAVNDTRLSQLLLDELGLELIKNEKRYKDDNGTVQRYLDEDTVVLFPSGELGKTWFGTTPEESDLMSGTNAEVSIVDTGVAVTTIKHTDPVTVETKVTMICLPSFEQADQVYILDTSNP